MASKSTQSKYQHQQRLNNMDNKFRNQLLTENKQKEEELKEVNLEIEERAVSKKRPVRADPQQKKQMGNHNVRLAHKRERARH